MVATALSVETRVLVERLEKSIATDLPFNAPCKLVGVDPLFMAVLWDEAF